jgi:hypothetical protein
MRHLKTFSGFINEYQTYSDYKNSKWGSPDDLKQDATVAAKKLIPVDWNEADSYIKTVVDQSDDKKGIKFEISLKTGDILHAYKLGSFRTHWEWYLNKKRLSEGEIYNQLEEKIYKPFDRWQRQYDMQDKYYMYADDSRSYKAGISHEKFVQGLYDKLSAADKKRADEHIEKTK